MSRKLSLKYWSVLLSLLIFLNSEAQQVKKFTSKSYSISEGLLEGSIKGMAEDGNGFLWISTGAGLQRFDGTNFETIHTQPGLPQITHITFFKLNNGNIWLRHENGISAYNYNTNKFQIIFTNTNNEATSSLSSSSFIIPLVPFAEINNEVWCWNESEKKFVSVNKFSGKIINSFIIPYKLQPTFYRFKKGNDNSVFYDAAENNIVQIDFIAKRIRYVYHANALIKNFTIINYTPLNNNNLLLTTNKGIYKANIETEVTTFLCPYPATNSKQILARSLTYLHDSLYALTLNNELFILNSINGKVVYQMVDEENQPFISKGYINKCISDSYNHLWILSDKEGLKKINFNNLGIKYYGTGKPPENFTKCIYPDKKSNLIIVGTLFNGINLFDTSQHLIKHFELSFREQTSCVLKIKSDKYLLFTNGDPGVYLLNSKNLQLTSLKKFANSFIPHEVTYFTYLQQLTDTTAALYCNSSIYFINYSSDSIKFTRINLSQGFTSAFIDHAQRLWLAQPEKYTLLSGKNFEKEYNFYLPQKIITKCFFEDNKNNLWIGTEKGVYKLNNESGGIIHIYNNTKDGIGNDSIYSITNDNKGNIWCGTNKGVTGIYTNNNIINLYEEDGLSADHFNLNSCAKAYDGELFFGGINGVNSFYPENIKRLAREPQILMTDIKVMNRSINTDSASWNLQHITLPYTNNVLSFYFSVFSKYDPGIYNYQYKMNGIDKEWVSVGNRGYARYVLPPGKYNFEYTAAGNELIKNIQHKYISITITPPFWKTIWFIAIMVICTIAIIIAIINLYTKQINRKKLRQLEIQRTVQLERERISRDLHDNIGAYATVLLASAEKLNNKSLQPETQKDVENVSENAKNIMSSLKETIWVLNNDAITITDFIDRFKLYAKKISSNFPNIHTNFKEELNKNFELSPVEALHLFRIMQEALQNAFKHANPQQITISIESNATLHISIKDDGKGFNATHITEGNGLYNMQHRAKEAGYMFNILSNDEGTEIVLKKNTSFAV